MTTSTISKPAPLAPASVNPRQRVADWAARYGVAMLRVSVGLIFLAFAIPKFIPGASPVEGLVMRTVDVLSFGLVQGTLGMVFVAALETFIGLTLVTSRFLGLGLLALGGAMVGFFAPLVLFAGDLLGEGLTFEAQYILKDIVLAVAALVIAVTPLRARSGECVRQPESIPTRESRRGRTEAALSRRHEVSPKYVL